MAQQSLVIDVEAWRCVLEDIDARLAIEQQELNRYKLTGTLAPFNRKK